jgi:hypothetical protein
VEYGTNSTRGHVGRPVGSYGVQKIVPSVTGLRFLEVLTISCALGRGTGPPPRAFCRTKSAKRHIAGLLLACALAVANAPAHAQAGATPATPDHSSTAGAPNGDVAQTTTVDDICRALEQSAAENALPVEFFARVIRRRAVSMRGRSAPREPKA